MKSYVKIGVVCLGRHTFDVPAAKEIYERIIRDLGFIENVDFTIIPEMVIEVEDARQAAERFNHDQIDGLIIISGTFHLGHLALELKKAVDVPVLLWGLKELPYNGGKIRLNSICGVNLNASNLYKSGCDDYHVIFGDEVDQDWIDALRVMRTLKTASIGILGYRAHGFFNVDVDELSTYKQLGLLINHYELSDVTTLEPSEELIANCVADVRKAFNTSYVTDEQVAKVARLAAAFKTFMDSHGLNGLAIRCWPEFARDFGISPCAAMSYLQSQGYILGCEGDVEGVISMLAHRAVGGTTPFLADLSQIDFDQNFALLWHCGVAPCNLWDGTSDCALDTYFAGGKGVTADFVMKSGDVSILRIDSARGKYRVFTEQGKAIPMEKQLKGTYMKTVFDHPMDEVVQRVLDYGIAHHVSTVYGHYDKVFALYAKLAGFELV